MLSKNKAGLVIVLVISLGLNLFGVGWWLGSHWQAAPEDKAALPPLPLRLPPLLRALPDSAQQRMGEEWQAEHRKVHQQLRRMRSLRREVHAALHREPFDPAALEQSLNALRERQNQAQAALHAQILRIAEELTPQERRQFAENMRHLDKRRGPRHARRWHDKSEAEAVTP